MNINSLGLATDKIVRPTAFILMAPAQSRGTIVAFTGTPAVGVTVLKDSSFPGGAPTGGTQDKRTRIDALYGDLHVGTLTWSDFILDQDAGNPEADANYRWDPAGHANPP
jgi:hypothetical protein